MGGGKGCCPQCPTAGSPARGHTGAHGVGGGVRTGLILNLGRSDQPPETSVQPAPPWFSHHVGFLGILRFSAQTLPGSGNTLRMWTGLPRAPGWEWAVGSSDEAGSTEILALLLPWPERWDCGQRRGGRDGGGRGWSAGPPWRLQDQHELSSPGGAAFLSSH